MRIWVAFEEKHSICIFYSLILNKKFNFYQLFGLSSLNAFGIRKQFWNKEGDIVKSITRIIDKRNGIQRLTNIYKYAKFNHCLIKVFNFKIILVIHKNIK